MNIEQKISYKAALLVIISVLIVIIVVLYIFNLRNDVKVQRTEFELHYANFLLTNELISEVNTVQLAGSRFQATNNQEYNQIINSSFIKIDSLISLLQNSNHSRSDGFVRMRSLLADQVTNTKSLSDLLNNVDPLSDLRQRINNYIPPVRETVNIVSIKADTIVRASTKKNLFRRLKDVFVPEADSTLILTNQRIDTLKLQQNESSTLLTEVDTITRKASKIYADNIKQIEQTAGKLLTTDRTIASQLSELLTGLYEETLKSVLTSIAKSEQSVTKNYIISIVGGLIALGIIILFIALIISDVNRGKHAREQLRAVLESRHRLLLSVSHDIKSPLSSIVAYLRNKTATGDDTRAMQHAASHILALLENLLEYSSLEQGTLQITYSTVDIEEFTRDIIDMFEPLATAKHLILHHQVEDIRLQLDVLKTRQIMINLISNAVKYTSQGEISVLVHYCNGYLMIQVKDTGAGIPADKIVDVFKPFTRIEINNTLAHGSGFGMFVVKGLIDLLKGSIEIESEQEKGTIVKVKLPANISETNRQSTTSKRIVVYDDDRVMHELVCNMLRGLGHQVVKTDYDMVLTDMEMGNFTGIDILTAEKEKPVFLMTGRADISGVQAKEMGFEGLILKPFTQKELKNIFGEAVPNESFFDGDDEEIMQIFRTSTNENQALLNQALAENDFEKAQAICHKMLPMMAQLGYPVSLLQKMDTHRANPYVGWQKDVEQLLKIKV
jgi:signal transduction histidine kinase/CheY-like chemotaxis protein